MLKMYRVKNELNHFTSDEVANILKVTKRTANRIISNWLDNGAAEWIGLEKVNGRGRPRQCYKFRGDENENWTNRK
jgi:predicted ArsR family transcriptional regulator